MGVVCDIAVVVVAQVSENWWRGTDFAWWGRDALIIGFYLIR